MSDNISKIKDRLSVIDVISGYIKVQKSGVNFKARCPFHNEKTPSFYISPERQIWHCFGCQKGGDIFGFIKDIEGVEFPEALRILAQKAGIELDHFDPAIRDEKTKLYDICETATRFYEKQLAQSNSGKSALEYLRSRGMDDATLKEFRLGFAPSDWHSLSNFLTDCGYSAKEIVAAGLAISRNKGEEGEVSSAGIYDRFRSRIAFPISDANDRVVGFTGRIFSAEGSVSPGGEAELGAKYINTPQTAIYDKSSVLYGLNKAKMEIRKSGKCVLVEGNMDAIMSYQAGARNVVASSGTALTPNHLRILQRHTNDLNFCFDTDKAGALATRRGIGLALSQNFNVRMVEMNDPECKDPADYVKKYGDGWLKLVDDSKPVVEFYFNKSKKEYDASSPEGKKMILAAVGPLVKRLVSHVEQSYWLSQLAVCLRAKEEDVKADMAMMKDDLAEYGHASVATERNPEKAVVKNSEGDILSEAFLSLLILKPEFFHAEVKDIEQALLSPAVAKVVKQYLATDIHKFDFDKFIKKFDGATSMNLEFAYIRSKEAWRDFKDDDLKKEFQGIIQKLQHRSITGQLVSLEFDIREADIAKDKARLSGLLKKFNELTQKLPK